jgi:AcrR family transcriptional regulator
MAYDSAATRRRILAAATAEFAAHGVAGARVDRIAENAHANKRAIYVYFGDKKALFAAVLEQRLGHIAEAVPIDGDDLPGYAQRLVDYHTAHPETMRLLLWEALELGDAEVPAEAARTRHYQDKVDAARDAGGTGDPSALVLFTLAVASYGCAVPQLRRMILGKDYPPERLRDSIAEAVRALSARSALRPGPRRA